MNITSGELHLPWLATGFLMAHPQLLAKLSFLSCMAPAVGLGPRTSDKGQSSSLQPNVCSHHGNLRSFCPTLGLGEDTAQPWIFSLPLHSKDKINDHRRIISLSGCSVPWEQNSWESHAMPGKLQAKRQKSLLVIKHAVNLCFSLPLASKTVPTLGILHNALDCQLTQNFNYWFRYWWGVGGGGH